MDGTTSYLYSTNMRKTVWGKYLWAWSSTSMFILSKFKSCSFMGEDELWKLLGPSISIAVSKPKSERSQGRRLRVRKHLGTMGSRAVKNSFKLLNLSLSHFKHLLKTLGFCFCCFVAALPSQILEGAIGWKSLIQCVILSDTFAF